MSSLYLSSFDIRLMKVLKKRGVPIGFFFRDYDYKFPPESAFQSVAKKIKCEFLKKIGKKAEKAMKWVDIVYLPSNKALEHFNFNRMKALPPASDNYITPKDCSGKISIYVGGLSERYGIPLLLEAYHILNMNEEGRLYKLLLVCRKEEYESFSNPYKDSEWLEVCHVSNKYLDELYDKADIALLPKKDTKLNDVGVSVKLFEYIGHGLPIVAAKSKAQAEII